jgi:hypothetical protein
MTLTTEATTAIELSEVKFLSISDLADMIDTGRIGHFRKKYYIRSQITEKSIEEKKAALISFDPASNQHYVEVKESFIFETNQDGTWNIVSGNTRTKALLSLYEAGLFGEIKLDDSRFKLIPYRVYNGLLSVHELIDYQVSTNDNTEKHNPLDLAIKIAELKPIYEAEMVDAHKASSGKAPSPKEQKTIAGLVTQRLCDDFKKTKAALTQYLNVASKGTDRLKQFVAEGKTSLDTANTVVQKLGGDKAKPEAVDKALDELWSQAKLSTGKDEAVIYKSQVLDYFKNLEDAKNPPEKNQGEGSDDGKSGEGGDEQSKQPPITDEIFVKNVTDAIDISYAVASDAFQGKQSDKVRKLVGSTSSAILDILEVVSDEVAGTLYDSFIDAFRQAFKNPEILADAIKASEETDLTKVNKSVSKVSSLIEKLHKELTTPPKAEKEPKAEKAPKAETAVATSETLEVSTEQADEQTVDAPEEKSTTIELEDVTAKGVW